MNWYTYIGWTATFCFIVSAVPQIIKTIRDGHAQDLTWGMLLLWLAGLMLMGVYTLLKAPDAYPLIFSYSMQTILVYILVHYKIFPRKV